jgi:hypothetical protein
MKDMLKARGFEAIDFEVDLATQHLGCKAQVDSLIAFIKKHRLVRKRILEECQERMPSIKEIEVIQVWDHCDSVDQFVWRIQKMRDSDKLPLEAEHIMSGCDFVNKVGSLDAAIEILDTIKTVKDRVK